MKIKTRVGDRVGLTLDASGKMDPVAAALLLIDYQGDKSHFGRHLHQGFHECMLRIRI